MNTLSQIKPYIDSELAKGVIDRSHSFHLLSLCSSVNQQPAVRTLVLRGFVADTSQIIFHSHYQSDKVKELCSNPKVCVLGYDKANAIQIRLYGIATICHQDHESTQKWQSLSNSARRCYLAKAPGAILDRPGSGYNPEFDAPGLIDPAATEYAKENFSRIKINFNVIDYLSLSAKGHARAKLTQVDGSWQANWIVP